MSRKAETSTPINDVLANRWSPRAYNGEAVDAATLAKLFEAARWAASGFNRQPWRYLVASRNEKAEFDRIVACLGEFNQVWAKNAGALVIVTTLSSDEDGKPKPMAKYNAGLATAQLVLEAHANGLHCRQMGGINRDAIRAEFNVPENADVIVCIAIGYAAPAETLSERNYEKEIAPRVRKPLSEIVFSGDWGKAADLS